MRQRMVVGAGLLVLGTVITVAIAWIGAATSDATNGAALELYARVGSERHWTVHRWNRATSTRIISRSWRGFGGGPYREGRPEVLLAGWGHIEPPHTETRGTVTQLDEAWGFPMVAMAYGLHATERADGSTSVSTEALWRVGEQAGGASARSLPLRPLWWGLATNSVLYAVACLVLYALARDATGLAARRFRRTAPAAAPGEATQSPYTS